LRAAVADVAEQHLILGIECEGDVATGVLPVRADLLERVVRLLNAHLGRPIAEIGDLEVPG